MKITPVSEPRELSGACPLLEEIDPAAFTAWTDAAPALEEPPLEDTEPTAEDGAYEAWPSDPPRMSSDEDEDDLGDLGDFEEDFDEEDFDEEDFDEEFDDDFEDEFEDEYNVEEEFGEDDAEEDEKELPVEFGGLVDDDEPAAAEEEPGEEEAGEE